jgi:hypothetical protein
MDDSQPNLTVQDLKSSSLQSHVLKTTPIKTMAVRYPEMVIPSPNNGYGRSNCSSSEAFKLCNGKEGTNSSKPWSDLLAKESIAHDDFDCTAFSMADNSILENEAENSTCSIWSLADEKPPHSHYFARDAATLAESLSDLNDLSSPDCNPLSSPSECLTYFGLEEFYKDPATLAAGTNEFVCIPL